ncbi:hypothetical protein [Vibrio coralliirubri]|uniref:hypothetical protein n=1 Tax=Vibrio coralliirubri TaxID=1516159 RepID=UPI002FDFA8DB
MFKLSMGFILGMFFTMLSFSLIIIFNGKLDIGIWTNIVIALATCVATALHMDSQRKLRRQRVWEVNKDILLELSSVLAQVIEELNQATDYHFAKMQAIEEEIDIKYEYKPQVYENFAKKSFDVLNVYKPLMKEELIVAIEELQAADDEISKHAENNTIIPFEAFDNLLFEYKKLQSQLNKFIKEIAGIQYT